MVSPEKRMDSRKWKQKPTKDDEEMIDLAKNSRFFLIKQNGPTSFVISADSGKTLFKVVIGGEHTCTCKKNLKHNCEHIV